jgi:hypothetical protein
MECTDLSNTLYECLVLKKRVGLKRCSGGC